jgi:hypothetical protein
VPKVAKGERPPLSDDCPGDYATLVEQVVLHFFVFVTSSVFLPAMLMLLLLFWFFVFR